MSTPNGIEVTVVHSPQARVVHALCLELPEASRVSDALAVCAKDARFTAVLTQVDAPNVGVWGKKMHGGELLSSGDRLEIYRPLRVDPKVARRERFKKQGAKSAGLFALRRPGAKAGY
jgi:uncharacterized protein